MITVHARTIEKVLGRGLREMGFRRLSPRTQEQYGSWIRRFLDVNRSRDLAALSELEVVDFLTDLAVRRRVSASTQSQAASALLFLFSHVLKRPIATPSAIRAPTTRRLPVVLTRREIRRVLAALRGPDQLVATLLYGSGLRLAECLQLRIKDLDFERHEITVRSGKGNRDRVTMLAERVAPRLRRHLVVVSRLHDRDCARGRGYVQLPGAFHRKSPHAARELKWQYVFPSARVALIPGYPGAVRHHRHPTAVQRAVRAAARDAGLTKRVTCHAFRHSFATHLLADGYDIRTVQELLGHRSVRTTMIYTHVLNRGAGAVRSPGDAL